MSSLWYPDLDSDPYIAPYMTPDELIDRPPYKRLHKFLNNMFGTRLSQIFSGRPARNYPPGTPAEEIFITEALPYITPHWRNVRVKFSKHEDTASVKRHWDGRFSIFLSEATRSKSAYVILGAIAHEAGHIHRGHLNPAFMRVRRILLPLIKLQEKENRTPADDRRLLRLAATWRKFETEADTDAAKRGAGPALLHYFDTAMSRNKLFSAFHFLPVSGRQTALPPEYRMHPETEQRMRDIKASMPSRQKPLDAYGLLGLNA